MSKKNETVSISLFRRVINPMPTFLVTVASKDGQANPIAIDWLTPISNNPPLLAFAIAPERHSYQMLCENPAFVVNVMAYDRAAEVMICGRRTGKNEDKWAAAGLTPVPAQVVNVSAIAEALAHVECQVEAEYPGGDHVLVVGRVVAVAADKGILANGLRDLVAAPPILHVGAGRLTTSTGHYSAY